MSDAETIRDWVQNKALELGIECLGVSDTKLQACEPKLQTWLNNGMHGEMEYMAKHGLRRVQAETLLPGTVSILSVRVPYVHKPDEFEHAKDYFEDQLTLSTNNQQPYVSLYARGRDYHKVLRRKLQQLADAIHKEFGEFGYRVAVDSAPTPEVEIARKAGLGWRGKHTLLIHPKAGSMFFLGELFTNLPLPVSRPFEENHCGQCRACIDECPTQAILSEGVVDARRCISYLTIEHGSAIPIELRKAMGTRIYGCDDCQLVCPWNKFSTPAVWADFKPRYDLDKPDLLTLLNWTEPEFLSKTEGMAIRRIGFERFQRNLAVAAGNSPYSDALLARLQELAEEGSELINEHANWAIEEQLKAQTRS